MKPKISIVDYGLCNLYNVSNAFEHIGANVKVISSPEEVNKAERIVLPGVGAFKNGMRGLNLRNLIDPLKEHAHKKLPFLGICLGMQMMFDISYEFGEIEGLSLISGKVEKIPNHGINKEKHKIPHIGWNKLEIIKNKSSIQLINNASMYFVHSYRGICANQNNLLAKTVYNGLDIASVVFNENSYGCQFHPEKSGKEGLNILKEFLNL